MSGPSLAFLEVMTSSLGAALRGAAGLLALLPVLVLGGCTAFKDKPSAENMEPVELVGTVVNADVGERFFVVDPRDPDQFLPGEILVLVDEGDPRPPEDARVRIEGRVRRTAKADLRKMMDPEAEVSSGRFVDEQFIVADLVEVIAEP